VSGGAPVSISQVEYSNTLTSESLVLIDWQVSGLVTFLSEPYRSASYEIVIESNQPQVMKNDWSFFCTKNAPSTPMPSRPASISIFTLARCSILLQTLQLVRSRMSLFRYPAAAAADGERVVAVSQQRRNRIYEHERRQLLLLTTTTSCSESEDEESANNVLKRLASSLSRSTPMQRRFWQVQYSYLHRHFTKLQTFGFCFFRRMMMSTMMMRFL